MRELLDRVLIKMASFFLYLTGKSLGYTFIRDLNLIVRHKESVILLESELESSHDAEVARQAGKIEVVRRVSADKVNLNELRELYVGYPIEINGETFVAQSKYVTPGSPKLVSGRRKEIKSEPRQEAAQSGLNDEDRAKIDAIYKALEDLPKVLAEMSKSQQYVVHAPQVIPPSPSPTKKTSQPAIPIILDEGSEVKSNLKDSLGTTTEDVGVLDKISKLKKTLNK